MLKRWRVAGVAIVALHAASLAVSQQVQTESGAISGMRERGLNLYHGVPFAAAPVGDLRWRPPARLAPWTGTRQALAFAPACMQEGVSMTGGQTSNAGHATVAGSAAAPADQLCRDSVSHVPGPSWIRERFFSACEKSQADHGRQLRELFIRNLGRAMFVFLPLLAALMKLLYWRSPRSYITHLVLLVHNHALVFLLMSTVLAVQHWIHLEAPVVLLVRGLMCYLVYYLYRSMQRVYAESWWRTSAKFMAVFVAYLACAACTVFLTGLYSAGTL